VRSDSRADKPLQVVHSDMMGPIRILGFSGERYIATLMDDYSRYSEVICVSNKEVVARRMIEVLLRWERQAGQKVQVIRTDRGTEFQGKLKAFCRRNGIVRQYSAPYVPEQNGRAERLNRTLAERTRALLIEHKVPAKLWPDAMRTGNYLRNRVPMSTQDKTPYELMYGRKPEVGHLRVFGCKGLVYRRKQERSKFEEVGEECMLVGYAENSKAWRVIACRNGKPKYLESPNIRFEESAASSLNCFNSSTRLSEEDSEFVFHDDMEPLHQGGEEDDLDAVSVASEDLDMDAGEDQEDAESSALDDLDIPDDGQENHVDLFSNPAFEDEAPEVEEPENRYSRRHRVKPSRFGFDAYAYSTTASPEDNPTTYKQALTRSDAEQ
jgi:hypothetical protein